MNNEFVRGHLFGLRVAYLMSLRINGRLAEDIREAHDESAVAAGEPKLRNVPGMPQPQNIGYADEEVELK